MMYFRRAAKLTLGFASALGLAVCLLIYVAATEIDTGEEGDPGPE